MKWRTAAATALIGCSTLGLWGCSEVKELAGDSLDTVADVVDSVGDFGGRPEPAASPSSAGQSKAGKTVKQKGSAPPKRLPASRNNSGQAHIYASFDPQTKLTVGYYSLPAGWQAKSTVVHNPAVHVFWRDVFLDSRSGAIGIYNSPIMIYALGSYRDQKLFKDKQALAKVLGSDLQKAFRKVEGFQLTSCAMTPNKNPKVLQMAEIFRRGAPGIRFVPLRMEARYSFKQNGKTWKGGADADIIANDMPMPGLTVNMTNILGSLIYAAPQEQFAAHKTAFTDIADKSRMSAEWENYIQQDNARLSAQTLQQARSVQSTLDAAAAVITSGYAERSARQDQISRGWSEAIRGVDTVADPFDSSRQVEISSANDHSWMNAHGEIINTNSTLFNPNQEAGFNSQEWRQVR